MFQVNDDNSIYVTRGDMVYLKITCNKDGKPYTFQPGEVIRFNVCAKKNCDDVVLQKDFPVTAVTQGVDIVLDGEDTKIGGVISKPTDYWYEVVLNPLDNPQTIIGYDEEGTRVFRLYPEANDKPAPEPKPEVIKVIDTELDMTSERPVQNQAIARAFANLQAGYEATHAAVAELHVTPEMFGAIGDGVADDTEAIQAALDNSRKVVFGYRKTYLVRCGDNGVALNINSDTVVDFNYSTIKIIPNARSAYHIVYLNNDNCTIMNGTLIGDKGEHLGTDGEYGQCVTVLGKNIEIVNMTMLRGWGDGVFIGKTNEAVAENIRMYNCKCIENRRNGMSIVAGKNIRVDSCAFNYTSGTAPQSGFDIEPNEDAEISVFMDNIECIGNGNSPFCLSNRHSTNCRVHIGKIYTEGSVLYIRSPEKSYFHIKDLYHVSKSVTGLHLVGGTDTHIMIDRLTLDMSDEESQYAIYSEGVYDCSIGDLSVLGNSITGFVTNSENCKINIGRLHIAPMVAGVSIAKTDVNIDTVARKTETMTTTNKQPKMFVNEITFDSSETITATIFCRNYPNEFTMKFYNPDTVSHEIYCDDGVIVNGDTEKSRLTLESGKMVEMRYYKTIGKWVVKSMF